MRTLAVAALASLAALAVASSAIAAPSVSLFWEGTGGASSIASAPGDTITLYIQVTPDVGIAGAQMRLDVGTAGVASVYYLSGADGITDDGLTWTPPASATYAGGGLTFLSELGCPTAAVASEATGNFADGFCGNNFQAEFNIAGDLGGGLVGPWGHLGVAGLITAPYTLAAVQFEVVPEPATGGLLALGLGALAFIGRRRA